MRFFKKEKKLYPSIEPFDTGFIKKGIHEIYYEQCGNPKGKPAVFLHGGPGGGAGKLSRRFFNPKKYRIILFDQRGCGKSSPYRVLENNNTDSIVDDIEKIRDFFKLKKFIIVGGSWGSTLALKYTIKFPKNIIGVLLRSVFLGTMYEIDWAFLD